MRPAHATHIALLLAFADAGCEKKQVVTASDDDSPLRLSYDSEGYLRQFPAPHIVRGTTGYDRFKRVAFVQFQVDGSEANPFVLCLSSDALPHDRWKTAREKANPARDSFGFPNDEPEPFARSSFSTREIVEFQAALEKSIEWHKLAVREKLAGVNKRLLSLTNRQFAASFEKPEDSTNFFVTMVLPELRPIGPNPSWSELTLDQRGVEKLAKLVADLAVRRSNYVTFRSIEAQQERERHKKESKDRARADEILR